MSTVEREQARAALHNQVRREGIGIMAEVFDVILDREEVTPAEIIRFLETDDDTGAVAAYEGYIVSGINRLSDAIQEAAGR